MWCIGNPLLQDDGAGPALFHLLSESPAEGIEAVNCEATPENYAAPLERLVRESLGEEPVLLIVADASDMGLPAGALRRLSVEDLSDVLFNAHGIPLSLILAPVLRDIELVVIGVQPAMRGLGESLSPEVSRSVALLARLLRDGRWGEIEPYQENCSPR